MLAKNSKADGCVLFKQGQLQIGAGAGAVLRVVGGAFVWTNPLELPKLMLLSNLLLSVAFGWLISYRNSGIIGTRTN